MVSDANLSVSVFFKHQLAFQWWETWYHPNWLVMLVLDEGQNKVNSISNETLANYIINRFCYIHKNTKYAYAHSQNKNYYYAWSVPNKLGSTNWQALCWLLAHRNPPPLSSLGPPIWAKLTRVELLIYSYVQSLSNACIIYTCLVAWLK